MRKRVMAAVLAVAAVIVLAGCGSKKEMSVDEVSGWLLKEITYQDELSNMGLDTAAMFLNLSDIDIKNAAIYETSGWTAEHTLLGKAFSFRMGLQHLPWSRFFQRNQAGCGWK